MDVLPAHVVGELRRHRLRLGNLLGLQPLPLEHVLEIHVAADVELHRAVQDDASVLEQFCQYAMGDGGADLRFDVVADNWQPGRAELLRPFGPARDEHRQAVDEGDTRVDRGLGIEFRRVFGADREIADKDVNTGLTQGGHYVHGFLIGLGDRLAVVAAKAIQGVTAGDSDAERWYIDDLYGVVLAGDDRLGQVTPNLLRVDVERRDELKVPDVVVAKLGVHQARHPRRRISVAVVLDPLDEGCGAVAYTDNSDTYRTHDGLLPLAV